MSKICSGIIVLIFIFGYHTTALAANLSIGTWQASGWQVWRTSFPTYSGSGASELYYPQSGQYLFATYEVNDSNKQSWLFEAAIAAKLRSQIGSDADWDYGSSNSLWYYGEFKTTGTSNYFNINRNYQINDTTSVFYGYSYYNSRYIMTDGLYSIENYNTVYNPLPDLNSSYNITYQGPHIGVAIAKPINHNYNLSASVAYTPLAYASGHGWWNLRDLSFNHTGPAQMLNANIALHYNPNYSNSEIELGYRYHYYSVFHGWEDLSSTISWDKAINIQRGLYINGHFKF